MNPAAVTIVSRVALPAAAAATLVPNLVPAPVSLASGFLLASVLGNPYADRTKTLASHTQTAALVGLGAGMNLHAVGEAGLTGLGLATAGITFSLGIGRFLGRALGIDPAQSLLTSMGTAICGGSAVNAGAKALKIKSDDPRVSASLGTIFLLNFAALNLFPWLGHGLHFSDRALGYWMAMGIHDTSSVVAAASSPGMGPETLEIATTVKMVRTLGIFPVAFALSLLERRGKPKSEKTERPPFPWFMVGFLGLAAGATFLPEVQEYAHYATVAARQLMSLTLFLIGSNINISQIRKVGPKPFVHGLALWATMGVLTFLGAEAGLLGAR